MASKAEVNARRAIANGRKKKSDNDIDSAVAAVLAGSRVNAPVAPLSGEGEEGFFDKPVVKSIIDAISAGTYVSANSANNLVDSAQRMGDGEVVGGAIDALTSIPRGVITGAKAAVGNDSEETVKTYSDVLDNIFGKVDDGDKVGSAIRGTGAFAGDVLLDPLTYATFGGAGLVKAGVRGAQEASALRKAGEGASAVKAEEGVATSYSKIEGFKAGWKDQKKKNADDKESRKEIRRVKRRLKGKSYDEQAEWLNENIEGLHPAVGKALIDDMEGVATAQKAASRKGDPESMGKAVDAPKVVEDADIPSISAMLDELLPKVPDAPSSKIKPVGFKPSKTSLNDVKPATLEAKVLDRIADVRATVPEKVTQKADDAASSIDDIEVAPFENWLKTNKDGIELTSGKVTSANKVRQQWEAAKNNPQGRVDVINQLAPHVRINFIKDTDLVVEEGIDRTTGNIRNIAKDIRSGKIDAKQFEDLAGTANPREVAKFLDQIAKTPEFRQTDKQMRAYNTGARLGISRPELGVSGHALLAKPSDRFSAEDILASKTPATPEESMRFLETKYTESATAIAQHKLGPELRKLADDIFYGAVGVQKLPGGELKTRRGASTNGPDKGAKFEQQWNTHASIWPITNVVRAARNMASNPSQRDDIIMLVMRDVDDRLRLAGIDPHLSNMRINNISKTVVRLAPSEVFEALPKSVRMKYIWGTGSKGAINEVLPSTVLDVAETLIRSLTRLNPDGTVDYNAGIAKALDALDGNFGNKHGNRTIERNLDEKTKLKNQEAIILGLKGRDSAEFRAFQSAGSYADKMKVVAQIKATDPDGWKNMQIKRMDSNVGGVLKAFMKGFRDGQPSVISDLLAINMRNASIHAGNVADKVTKMAKEDAEKIMATFNTGKPSEHLNALVVTPPYPHNGKIDPAIFQMRKDLKGVAQSQVLNGAEAKHLNSIGKVENFSKKPVVPAEAARRNADAYQELPEGKDIAVKNPKDLTQDDFEKAFDIAVREANVDIIYRAYGPSRFFNKRAGLGRSFDTITGSTHAATHLMTGFHNVLRSWAAQGVTKESARVAFKELQNKVDDIPLSPVAQQMDDLLKFMFATEVDGVVVNNFLTRNTVGPAHFNKVLNSIMDDDSIRVPVDATPAEMAEVWKEWPIENPLDFFSKMQRAMVKTAEDVSMGAAFSKKFGVDKPQPGYKRVIDSSNNSEFLPLIDTAKYYPVEIIDEIPMISRLITESRTFKPGTNLHTFVTRVWDPVISNIKMTQTTLKPGHHVMSMVGDTLRNSLEGMGGSTKEYGQMWRILHTRFGAMKGQDEMDAWANVKEIVHNVDVGKNTNQRHETMIIGGKKVKVSHDDLYALMQQQGVALPPHLGGVDVDEMADFDQFGAGGNAVIQGIDKVTRTLDKVANNNLYSLNNFTAHRDTFGRGALFMHKLQEKNFKSLAEAAEYAGAAVRKAAPTSADLGGFEAKYARRTFLYYTWLRGQLPRIVEGALMRPGIALAPSKAMYEMAVANGVDPTSIGDPFPDDTLFPSWYHEKVLGPQWETADGDLWGFNPTSPVLDVMNSLGSNVSPKDLATGAAAGKIGGTLMNMSTPWFKVPMEMTMGQTLDGGRPIQDKTQYLTDIIGPVRVASRIAGKDVIPSADPDGNFGFANRTEAKYRQGLDEDFGPNMAHELLNWATGMGFTNYTSDSAQNSAEFEERDKLIQDRKQWERYG